MSGDTFNVSGQAGAVSPSPRPRHDLPAGSSRRWHRPAEARGGTRPAAICHEAEPDGPPEQDETLGAIAAAEKAATKGDGARTLKHLKGADRWALGIAEKIGVSVATKAIEKAMAGS